MKVGVIGLGYVGLPLAVAFAEADNDVIALDVDPLKVSAVTAGDSYIEDIPSERLQAVLPRIRATYRYADLAQGRRGASSASRRPLTENREPDLGPLDAAAKSLAQVLQPRSADRARVDHLPGHDARAADAAARGLGPAGRHRHQPRLLARARRPGAHRLHAAQHAQGGRRDNAGVRWTAPTSCTAASAITSSGSPPLRPPS